MRNETNATKKKGTKNQPGGLEPKASHRSGDFTPAFNISLGETIFTLSGFTVAADRTMAEKVKSKSINMLVNTHITVDK